MKQKALFIVFVGLSFGDIIKKIGDTSFNKTFFCEVLSPYKIDVIYL